jgi:hypothetical protein
MQQVEPASICRPRTHGKVRRFSPTHVGLADRVHPKARFCRGNAFLRGSEDIGASRASALHHRTSVTPSTPQLRENARGVCVARWYDPNTGEFLSVDPDFSETLFGGSPQLVAMPTRTRLMGQTRPGYRRNRTGAAPPPLKDPANNEVTNSS